MRIAAGICVLATGLLFGAGSAIAGADSEPSSSSGPGQGAEGTSQGTGATTGTAGSAVDNQPTVGTLSDTEPADPPSEGGPEDGATTTPLNTDDEEEGAGTGSSEPLGTDTETVPAETGATEPDTTVTTPAPTVPADATSSSSDAPPATPAPPATSAPIAPPPAPKPVNPMGPMIKAFQPVTNAVNDMADAFSSVPRTFAALPTSPTPITDAIASVQALLTSVADVWVPLANVPGDLYALLGVQTPPAAPPLIGGSGSFSTVRGGPVDAPLFGAVGGHGQQVVAPANSDSLFGTMVSQPSLGTVASTSMTAPLAVSGTVPLTIAPSTNVRSIFEHVIEAVLVPASLTALAAVALPGVGALLVVCAAGIRVGYRQAKAGLALRASGIARFAGAGPLGVVRSGSLVALRQRARGPRTARAVCPEAARSARALEPVA